MIGLVLVGYFLIGFITMSLVIIHDMRGEQYDPNFFDKETIFGAVITFFCGYFAPLLVYIACNQNNPRNRKHLITRLLHKLSNIGIKK